MSLLYKASKDTKSCVKTACVEISSIKPFLCVQCQPSDTKHTPASSLVTPHLCCGHQCLRRLPRTSPVSVSLILTALWPQENSTFPNIWQFHRIKNILHLFTVVLLPVTSLFLKYAISFLLFFLKFPLAVKEHLKIKATGIYNKITTPFPHFHFFNKIREMLVIAIIWLVM